MESYIEEKPDSALVTLEPIDLSELSGKEEKAKYALLYSMALDKNFIDKTQEMALESLPSTVLRISNEKRAPSR